MFLNDWKDSKLDGMAKDFELQPSQLKGIKILLASYSYQDYSGSAFVLYKHLIWLTALGPSLDTVQSRDGVRSRLAISVKKLIPRDCDHIFVTKLLCLHRTLAGSRADLLGAGHRSEFSPCLSEALRSISNRRLSFPQP